MVCDRNVSATLFEDTKSALRLLAESQGEIVSEQVIADRAVRCLGGVTLAAISLAQLRMGPQPLEPMKDYSALEVEMAQLLDDDIDALNQ